MEKNINLCVDLKTVMQTDAHLAEGQPYNGLLTRDGQDHYIFEESCQRKSCQRNPKLFDGQYCSLVHMQNGKYQIHMKTINASAISDRILVSQWKANHWIEESDHFLYKKLI